MFMKLTVLGHWGAYPKAGEATSGYLIEHEGENILIDCGSGVLAQLQRYQALHELSYVFITHSHYDHIADLGCLQYACLIDADLQKRGQALPIYLAEDAEQAESAESGYKSMNGSTISRFSETDTFEIKGLKLSFFQTFHERYCLAVKIQLGDKTLVYTADTSFDESLIGFCQNADVLIAETSFYADFAKAKAYGHMNAAEVGRLASESNVDKLVLTHLPHFGEVEKLVQEVKEIYEGEAVLAHSGLELLL
jgi:ribonuclease BN (tRNA processing enzyme)